MTPLRPRAPAPRPGPPPGSGPRPGGEAARLLRAWGFVPPVGRPGGMSAGPDPGPRGSVAGHYRTALTGRAGRFASSDEQSEVSPMSPAPPPPPAPEGSGVPPRPPAPPPSPSSTRQFHGIALGLAAASVMPAVVLGGASATPAAAVSSSASRDQRPSCGDPATDDFPIGTRIRGGPDTYAPGGGYGTWFLDLTNTTTRSCRDIHPVLVLTDEDRKLTAAQIQLEFSEGTRPGVEHRVVWETTDRDEHIGVFGGDGADAFPGFTVPAGRTVTVQVRMAFTSDTSPGRITASAAIVQRLRAGTKSKAPADKGATVAKDDGDWVGESEDYPFTVVEDGGEDTGEVRDTGDDAYEDAGSGEDAGDAGGIDGTREGVTGKSGTGDIGGGSGDGDREGSAESPRPDAADPGATDPDAADDPGATASRPDSRTDDPVRERPELARTGPASTVVPGVGAAGFLIAGGAVVLASRRRSRPPA